MSEQHYGVTNPPTNVDLLDDDIRPRPKWPKVIGIISIVLGSLGLVCGAIGAGSMFFLPSMMSGQTFEGGTPPVFPYQPAPTLMMAAMFASLIWTIVLIVAGAMTASRKPIGRPVHLLWAAVAILIGALSMKMQVDQQNALAAWLRDNPSSQIAQMTGGNVGGLIGLVVAAFFSFAWPLFVLCWFLLVKKRNADIAEGVEEVIA